MIKIFIASDHAGIELKTKLVAFLREQPYSGQYQIFDLGPSSTDSVDYPDFADLVCHKIHGLHVINSQNDKISRHSELGILICGSGQGMAMRANKFPHIRAALCPTPEYAKLSREHNDANVLCLGARLVDHSICQEIVRIFLETSFAGGRHSQRVGKVSTPV